MPKRKINPKSRRSTTKKDEQNIQTKETTASVQDTEEKVIEEDVEVSTGTVEAVDDSSEEVAAETVSDTEEQTAPVEENSSMEKEETEDTKEESPLQKALNIYVTTVISSHNERDLGAVQGNLWVELSKVVTNDSYEDFRKGWVEYLTVIDKEKERAFSGNNPYKATTKPVWPYDPSSAKAFNMITTIAVGSIMPNRDTFLARLDVSASFRGTALDNNATVIQNITQFYG